MLFDLQASKDTNKQVRQTKEEQEKKQRTRKVHMVQMTGSKLIHALFVKSNNPLMSGCGTISSSSSISRFSFQNFQKITVNVCVEEAV